MCRVLGVSPSGYYVWRKREPSQHSRQDQRLQRRIIAIHQESRKNYASVKIHKQLKHEGVRCSRKRVIRLMKRAGLVAKRQRCFKRTTQRNPVHPAAPNRLQQLFHAERPNQVWLADITYIATDEGWLYLAAVMDLFSRLIVGWAMDGRMTDALSQQALGMALTRRTPSLHSLLHHSDRGSQYTSGHYQALLERHNIQVSMSGTGNCYDNAPRESFFSLLKTELVHHERYATRQAAKTTIFDYIEVFYNRQRIHGALDYLTPVAFEERWLHSFSLTEVDSLSPHHYQLPMP
jgi:transposase InsO family protein